MTTPEKAEPERSAISSTDCRHCLTHPLPGPHTDGKCCLCGITREVLDEPKKCGYGEHDFKPFQGYRDEPGKPHCLTCGHAWGECTRHLAEKPEAPDVVHKHVHAYQTGGVFKCSCGAVRLLTDPGEEPPLTPEEEEEASKDACCGECGSGAGHSYCGPCSKCEPEEPLPPQPDRRPPYLLAYSVQGHLYELALPGDATVAALDGRLVITHQLGPVAGICQIAPITSEESA